MYLPNQHKLPKPTSAPRGKHGRWRLHFEYKIESEQEAQRHATECQARQLPVKRDPEGHVVQRRVTIAVLTMKTEQHDEIARFSASTTCSWTDTFKKETGRQTALARLETEIKGTTDDGLTPTDRDRLAHGVRYAYNQRSRYQPLPDALQYLKEVVYQTDQGESPNVDEIRQFLKQFN